ncbi:methyl-accepting chemotaxis protein [Lysobacter sp. LF1]|uniref:Methyl-accepting chemotaxis protein n=1 Tax=Lysobacter stagni TaxID=3045172 RepID=A0ABT6XBX5_9GAMM|nr:methyl-accepting chemotaxis protein [Lysobacter sp. LF1]MDI9237440.1 methyl-accepting chemotaxis protein [Lysobacter sp. LF1]
MSFAPSLFRFSSLSLRTRFVWMIAVLALGLVAITAIAVQRNHSGQIEFERARLNQRVGAAMTVVQRYADLAKAGTLPEDVAKREALAVLGTLRSKDGTDYLWVNDEHPRMLMHPHQTNLNGKDLTDFVSADKKRIFVEMVKTARAGGGFVDYQWPKPGVEGPVLKISYVALQPRWGWVIGSGEYTDDIAARNWRFAGMLLSAALIALAAVVLLCVMISRSIAASVRRATQAAQAMADGDFSQDIHSEQRDEIGQMLQALERMRSRLDDYALAQGEMARRHDEGQISFRIDESAFPGAYGRMAHETNALVASHIDAIQRALAIMERYAVGDLSQDMDRLPGEKAVLTRTMDSVKGNLRAINAEIQRLAASAADGDFAARGEAERFQHDFRIMVETLNRLMATADDNLSALSSLLQGVARGDLEQRMQGEYRGVFARMSHDANETVDRLAQIVSQIREGSDAIGSAAGEIAAGNNDLSQRTEQQAASLEETASSMEELTSTVRANADNARQANQLAQTAAGVAGEGGAVVARVVRTMDAISDSSRRISEIIGVIDGIAFQTNILALNAAVEAARAGEQGRGFAVVAAEVRSLAQRSANAAKEIKQLITDSVVEVQQGTQLVGHAGRTMEEIVTSVKKVTDVIADISAASLEQSAGIEQINNAITQMDEGTQQNAALVEEASAAARSLEQQAEQLVRTVAVFRLAHGAPIAPAADVVVLPAKPVRSPSPTRPVAATRTATPARPLRAPAANGDSDWQEF